MKVTCSPSSYSLTYYIDPPLATSRAALGSSAPVHPLQPSRRLLSLMAVQQSGAGPTAFVGSSPPGGVVTADGADLRNSRSMVGGGTRESLPKDSTRQERQRLATAIGLLSSGGTGGFTSTGGRGAHSEGEYSSGPQAQHSSRGTRGMHGSIIGAEEVDVKDLMLLQSMGRGSEVGGAAATQSDSLPISAILAGRSKPAQAPLLGGNAGTSGSMLVPLPEDVEYSTTAAGGGRDYLAAEAPPLSPASTGCMDGAVSSPNPKVKSLLRQQQPPSVASAALLLDGTAWHEVEALPIRDPVSKQLVSP